MKICISLLSCVTAALSRYQCPGFGWDGVNSSAAGTVLSFAFRIKNMFWVLLRRVYPLLCPILCHWEGKKVLGGCTARRADLNWQRDIPHYRRHHSQCNWAQLLGNEAHLDSEREPGLGQCVASNCIVHHLFFFPFLSFLLFITIFYFVFNYLTALTLNYKFYFWFSAPFHWVRAGGSSFMVLSCQMSLNHHTRLLGYKNKTIATAPVKLH